MDTNEFALIRALMQNNDDMRVIAVGDDDQNIYEFRGSDSAHIPTIVRRYLFPPFTNPRAESLTAFGFF